MHSHARYRHNYDRFMITMTLTLNKYIVDIKTNIAIFAKQLMRSNAQINNKYNDLHNANAQLQSKYSEMESVYVSLQRQYNQIIPAQLYLPL